MAGNRSLGLGRNSLAAKPPMDLGGHPGTIAISKERYFEPVAKSRGLIGELGGGRKRSAPRPRATTARSSRIALRFGDLEERIGRWPIAG